MQIYPDTYDTTSFGVSRPPQSDDSRAFSRRLARASPGAGDPGAVRQRGFDPLAIGVGVLLRLAGGRPDCADLEDEKKNSDVRFGRSFNLSCRNIYPFLSERKFLCSCSTRIATARLYLVAPSA